MRLLEELRQKGELDLETLILAVVFLILFMTQLISAFTTYRDRMAYAELGGAMTKLRSYQREVLVELYQRIALGKGGQEDLEELKEGIYSLLEDVRSVSVREGDIFQRWVKDELSLEISCTVSLLGLLTDLHGEELSFMPVSSGLDSGHGAREICELAERFASGDPEALRVLRETLRAWSSRRLSFLVVIAIYVLTSIVAILRTNWRRVFRALLASSRREPVGLRPPRFKDFAFLFSIQFLAFLLSLILISRGDVPPDGREAFLLNLKAMGLGYIITIALSLALMRDKLVPRYDLWRLIRWASLGALRGVKLFLSTSIFIVALELILNEVYPRGQLSSSPLTFFPLLRGGYWLVGVVVGLLAPVYEEMAFRVSLYGALRRFIGVRWSVVGASAIFALVHPENLLAMIVLFLLGTALSLTYELSDNLMAPLTYHALWNTLTFAVAWLQ